LFPAFYTLCWGLVRQPDRGSIASIGHAIPSFFGGDEYGDVDDDVKEQDILAKPRKMLEPTIFYVFREEEKEHLGECWGSSLFKYIDKFLLFSVSNSTIGLKEYIEFNNIITWHHHRIMTISFSKSENDPNSNFIFTIKGTNLFLKLNRDDII